MNPANNSIAAVFNFLRDELVAMYGQREAHNMANQIMLLEFGKKRTDILVNGDEKLTESDIVTCFRYRDRLLSGEPLQYILGSASFYDLEIGVESGVLIPRPETEELVHWALSECNDNETVWDIGTGSGCIALAIKKNQPSANVVASDISLSAIEIAKANAKQLSIEVDFVQHDILADSLPDQKFGLIISNPPYILQDESKTMQDNVTKHEPSEALFTTTDDPLQFYKRITAIASDILLAQGKLFFECHESYAAEVKTLLIEKGFVHVELRADMQGKPRMVRGIKA